MKNIKLYSLLIAMAVFFSACDDDEHKGDSPDFNDHVGAVTTLSVNPDKNFFNLLAADFAAEEVEFTVDIDGFGLTEVNSVDVEIVYTEKDANFNQFKQEFEDSVYAPIVVANINSFPSTVAVSAAEVAAALSRTASDFNVGDGFSLTLPINTADGRRLTVALNSDLCNEPAQPSFGGCGVAWAVACPSEIPEGAWTANVGGYVMNITANGGGNYSIDNFNLDYEAFYGTFGGLTLGGAFSDVCNTITLTGSAQFGVSWRGTGIYDPVAQTITIPEISEVGFGRGPYDNGGAGYVLTKN